MDIVVREHSVCETAITLPGDTANDPRNLQRLIAERLVLKHLKDQGYILAQPLRIAAEHVRGRTFKVSVSIMGRKTVGQRLRDVRKDRGLTQEQLAKRVPCSPNYLSKLELGQVASPDPTIVRLIEQALVSPNGHNGHH